MDVFDLSASLTLDTSNYEQQLNKAAKSTDDFTGSTGGASSGVSMFDIALGGLAAQGAMAAINALADLTKQVIGLGDDIDKNSRRANMSAATYQEWGHVLQLSGGNASSLTSATRSLSTVITQAGQGTKTAIANLTSLGLSYQQLASMSPEQQFEAVVYALSDLESGAERTALAQQLLGRAGMDLIPTLDAGRDSIAGMRQEAHNLGAVLSDEAIASSVQVSDEMTRLKGAFMGAAGELVASMLPAISALVEALTGLVVLVKDAINWITNLFKTASQRTTFTHGGKTFVVEMATDVEQETPALETATKTAVQRATTAATTTAKKQGRTAGTTLAKAITDPILQPQDETAQICVNNLRTAIETVARSAHISLDMNLDTGTLDSLSDAYGSTLVDKVIQSMIIGWDNGVPIWAEHVNTNFGSIREIIENHLKEYFGLEGVIQEVPQRVNAYMQALNTAFQQAGTMGALQGQGVDMGIFSGLDMTQGQNSQLFTQVAQMLQQIVALGGEKGAEMANALLEQLITITDEGLIEVNELTLERYTELIEQLREQQEEAQQESTSSTTDYAGTVINNIGVLFQSGGEGWKSLLLNYGQQIGKNMLAGMQGGIENDWGPFEGWLTSLMQMLIKSISGIFGIFSPSRVFADIGENLILGLQEGVADTFAPFERSTLADMQSFADSAANALSGASANTRRVGWTDSALSNLQPQQGQMTAASHALESNINFSDSIMKGMRDFQGQMTAEMLNAISALQGNNGGGQFHATIELGGAEVGEQVFNLNREHIRSIATSRDAMASTILRR